MKWGLWNQWMYLELSPLLCISLLWLRFCPWFHSFDYHFSPLKCLIRAARDLNLYLQPHHPVLWPHWINNWSLNLLDFDIISSLPLPQMPCALLHWLLYCCQEPVQMSLPLWSLGRIHSHFHLSYSLTHFFSLFGHSLLQQVLLITQWMPTFLRHWDRGANKADIVSIHEEVSHIWKHRTEQECSLGLWEDLI